MPWTVVDFEPTPNPAARICRLDRPLLSDSAAGPPRSFRRPEDAAGVPLAHALFEAAGLTSVLFGPDWITVNKPPKARWGTVRRQVERVLAEAADEDARAAGEPEEPAP